MNLKPQRPTVTNEPGVGGDKDVVERHPAFAQIGASRVHGSVHLYGSDFKHNDFICIRISLSQNRRSLSQYWPFAHKEIVELWMSEAQWATFVSSMNMGQGTQCTLRQLGGEQIAPIEPALNTISQFRAELGQMLGEAQEELDKLERAAFAGKDIKRSELKSMLNKLRNSLKPGIEFLAKQFGTYMETTTEKAKTEINAYALRAVQEAGLKALREPTIEVEQLTQKGKTE